MRLAESLVFLTFTLVVEATPPPLSFSQAEVELPPLSLLEGASKPDRRNQVFDHARSWVVPHAPSLAKPGAKAWSQMPIVTPPDDIDPKFIITPDPSIDYKMLIKTPDQKPRRPRKLGAR